MTRFLITNTEKFTGQAEVVYNKSGILCIIDCTDTNMDQKTVHHFKSAVPASIDMIGEAFGPATTIVRAGFKVTFENFYKDYPLKRNRYKAEKVWTKLNDTDKINAWQSLTGYKKYLKLNSWQSAMIADSYLTRKEYETDWSKVK